jgi:hypothetical protein
MVVTSTPMIDVQLSAHRLGAAEVALGMLLDQPLEQADGEGDAGRLDRLQVDRREQGVNDLVQRTELGPLERASATGSAALQRSATVGPPPPVMSKTTSGGRPTTPAGGVWNPADQGAGKAVFGKDFVPLDVSGAWNAKTGAHFPTGS